MATSSGVQGELAPSPEAQMVWGAVALAAFIFWRGRQRLRIFLAVFLSSRR